MEQLHNFKTGCNENTSSFLDIPAKDAEGDQNLLPQNMVLWQKHYFKLKENENQQIQEEFSALPFICLKPGKFLFEKGVSLYQREKSYDAFAQPLQTLLQYPLSSISSHKYFLVTPLQFIIPSNPNLLSFVKKIYVSKFNHFFEFHFSVNSHTCKH